MAPRRRRFSRLSAFYCVVTLGAMVAGSLAIDRSPPVLATVSGKHEEIQYSLVPQGAWYRFYRVGVTFPTPDGASMSATVSVSQERYDALHLGDTLRVHPLPAFPLLARTADRSTLTVVRELATRAATDEVLAPLVLWLVAGAIGLSLASRVGTSAILVAGLGWTALGVSLLLPAARPIVLPSGATRARVRAIGLVDRAPERRTGGRRRSRMFGDVRRLRVPYQVVQLRIAAPRGGDSLLVVDAVDSGSVPGLVHNAVLPLRYDAASPRDGRLTQGTRTFRERNRYHFLVPVLGVGLLGMLWSWGARDRRLRRRSAPMGSMR